MLFAVNGTLMRGLELSGNLTAAGGRFVREATTAALYRLFSVNDLYPGMIRAVEGGATIALELWEISLPGLTKVLEQEPRGLCLGRVVLADASEVWGVLAEPWIVSGQKEITAYGSWRAYRRVSTSKYT